MEPALGFEPRTYALQVRSSTPELSWPDEMPFSDDKIMRNGEKASRRRQKKRKNIRKKLRKK